MLLSFIRSALIEYKPKAKYEISAPPFSKESPEDIIRLITAYPEFKRYYEDAYELCRNTEPDTVLARTLGEITVSASDRILSDINYGL